MEESHCAYSLSQTDSGWMWRLFDEDGVMIADGSAPDQSTAQKGVMAAFWRGVGSASSFLTDEQPGGDSTLGT